MPDFGYIRVGWRGQDKPKPESIKKMCPQNSRLKSVKCPLHPNRRPVVHLHQAVPLVILHKPRPCMAARSFALIRKNFPFLYPLFLPPHNDRTLRPRHYDGHQNHISSVCTGCGIGVCTAYLFLVVHSVVYSTIQSPEGTFVFILQKHFLLNTYSRAIGP